MLKLIAPMVLIMAILYGSFRFGGEYTFLSEGDNISQHAGKTLFNIPVVSGSVKGGLIEIQTPYTGIRFVDISHDEDKGIHGKQCGRLKVKLDPNSDKYATFVKSGCFLDW